MAGCGNKESSSAPGSSESTSVSQTTDDSSQESTSATEAVTQPQHISPRETVSAVCGSQVTSGKTIPHTEGSNTLSIPLSDLIQDGDIPQSFTFVIYSGDGANIGTFKGGCGISVTGECTAATDEGWYQSADFSAATQGTYGEIKWDVPAEIQNYVSAAGELLFGYWWGNAASVKVDCIVCTYSRTRELPVDGTVSADVHKSVGYNDTDNTIHVKADFLPDGAIPEVITYNVSSSGAFGKFTGAFGISSGDGCYNSADTAVFTDSSSLSLTWFVEDEAKNIFSKDGDIVLGYWWSDQPTVSLDSVSVKYSLGAGAQLPTDTTSPAPENNESNNGFRSASQIVSEIKVGWNLGNTLECYDYKEWTSDAETAWGNPKTTLAMIQSVKSAGFNAVRIPVTWSEHMNGDTIDAAWMKRVHEVVDLAYNEGLFVILNMHHDDYIWFEPKESEYSGDSAKLKAIWTQISAEFGSYGDRLLFEGMNEPRTVGSANEWMGGTSEEREVINRYEQDFVDTVRASGGNNAERTLIVTSYAASAESAAMDAVKLPSDDNIILSIHYYAPWLFSEGQSTVFGDAEKSELDAKFREMKQKFIDKGVPLIIGEFGCVAGAANSTRAEYYRYYISAAKSQGIKCFVWDNNVTEGEGSYGLFDRETLTWNSEILSGIMDGAA